MTRRITEHRDQYRYPIGPRPAPPGVTGVPVGFWWGSEWSDDEIRWEAMAISSEPQIPLAAGLEWHLELIRHAKTTGVWAGWVPREADPGWWAKSGSRLQSFLDSCPIHGGGP